MKDAADNENAKAITVYASLLFSGYIKILADDGYVEAMKIYSTFQQEGIGVKKTSNKPLNIQKMQQKGDFLSNCLYSNMLRNGIGVEKDTKKADLYQTRANKDTECLIS